MRESTSLLLQEYCSTLICAVDGEDAFSQFTSHPIDLVISNLSISKINGIEFIRKIKDINSEISILMLSKQDEIELLLESVCYAIEGYLLNPLNKRELDFMLDKIKVKIMKEKEQKQRLRLQQEYQGIVDNCSIVSKADIHGNITYVNNEFCRTSGYSQDELIGKQHNIIRCPNEPEEVFKSLWVTIKKNKEIWQGIIKNRTKNGDIYYVKSTIKPIFDEEGEVKEFIALRTLVTDIIHPRKRLLDFISSVKESIVILMKIENFSYIETSFGKMVSAKIQKEFTKKLFAWQPKNCSFSKIYHLDDGEFVFAKIQDTGMDEVNNIINRIRIFQDQTNSAKINISPIDYDLSFIVSIAYGANALENAKIGLDKLLQNKEEFILANDLFYEQQNKALHKLKTFKMVRQAIDSYNIISYFQPIVNNRTKKVEKYESLVRLINHKKEIISPSMFLDTAKEGKYYKEITSMVLTNSFQALSDTSMDISINLSSLDIQKEETVKKFLDLLEAHKTEAHRIVLELLEDEKIENIHVIQDFIQKVKLYGVHLAIDDFGEGYSNFTRLLKYKPNFIKIDGSLIKHIEEDDFSKHMVETIVTFAKKRNIKTIAEYVENRGIFEILCHLGVDYSQGYYLGKPDILK